MIEIKRSKKKIIDDFGSYRLEYTAINKDKSKNFIIYFLCKRWWFFRRFRFLWNNNRR